MVKVNITSKLSVVVIAYNNELYVEETLESLNEQTFQDMEVIVVNDFSSDKTGEIIENYIKDKPKFTAVHLKENSGGCSTPRNTGLRYASGKYVMFLDGDDWYTVDACEKMVSAIERTGSDFVGGQVIRTNNYEIWYYNQIYSKERININIREFKTLLFDSLSVNKIYNRSFLDKHNLRFPEGIHYEDVVFTGKAYFLAESVSIIPEPVYYWRVVENADVKSITNRRYEFDNFKNRIIAHRYFDQFLRDIGAINYLEHKNNKFLRHDLKLYTNDYLEFDNDYRDKFHKAVYEYMHEVMDEYTFINLSEINRIMYYLLYIGDRDAFDDFIAYSNGLDTEKNRIYNEGNQYYFKSSSDNKFNKKFLRIAEPAIDYNIRKINLTNEKFSFHSSINMLSVNDSDITYFWRLRNNLTGNIIYPEKVNSDRIEFDTRGLEPGDYYLSLFVNHMGILHKRLVKKSEISSFKNEIVKDNRYSKKLLINQRNSFALRVSPEKRIDQLLFMFLRRSSKDNVNNTNRINNIISGLAKKIVRKLPIKSKWILFESHMGKQYSDSPKYIYEELLSSNKKYKYIWSFENPDTVVLPGFAKKVKKNSLKYFYYLNRSKYWVDNQGIAHLTPKKPNQVYLQTWHGTPLKKMGYDQNKLPNKNELARLKVQTDAWDYFISPNQYSTNIFRRAFRYNGSIIETGYPRNDVLVKKNNELLIKTKETLGITVDKKVYLYAPTFRDWDSNSFQRVYMDIQKISMDLKEDAVILLRLHYLLSKKINNMPLPKNIINVSEYQDIQELYLISDLLITDYSSVMFDFAVLNRPIIFYCYDLDEYTAKRGLYINFKDEAPGPILEDIQGVISYLNNPAELLAYDKALQNFRNKYTSLEDGTASKRVIEKVFL